MKNSNNDLQNESNFNIEGDYTLKPTYFLHLIYLKAIEAPHVSPDAKTGLLRLQIAADQARNFAIAAKKINNDDLKAEIEKYKKELNSEDIFIQDSKIANFILRYILEHITDTSEKTGDLMI